MRLKNIYFPTIKLLGIGLGVDADYFMRSGVYGVIQQLVGLMSGLALAYIFGHFLSPAIFGEYNLVLSIVAVLTIVTIPGLNFSLLRSVSAGYDSSLVRT